MNILLCCFPFLFLLYILITYLSDQEKSFSEYLIPELQNYGFTFVSSAFYQPGVFEVPFNDLDEDRTINPVAGGLAVAPVHVYRHLRMVVFEDRQGKRHEVLAAVEFKNIRSKQFKRVRWKPELVATMNNGYWESGE